MDPSKELKLIQFYKCTVIAYLHLLTFLNSIMYRDIKPDNIGFDVRGDIKIFDFGLAKEFDPSKRDPQGFFKLTEDTGSPRYMDPTVALGKPYNELCDVYSFSILLWQMLELDTPFEGFTMNMFTKKVVEGGTRPLVNDKWSQELQTIMRKGWGHITKRPSMADVCEVLREELSRLNGEDVQEDPDVSRKSEASMRGMRKSVLSARALYDVKNELRK
jgi:serine/threonine protein kinase